MNINLIRFKSIVEELRLIRSTLDRMANLYELHLQHTERLTTQIVDASPQQLSESRVSYTDPAFGEMATIYEQRLGRAMTDEESQELGRLMAEEEATP